MQHVVIIGEDGSQSDALVATTETDKKVMLGTPNKDAGTMRKLLPYLYVGFLSTGLVASLLVIYAHYNRLKQGGGL